MRWIDEVRDLGDSHVVALRVHAHGRGSGVPVEQSVWQAVKFRGLGGARGRSVGSSLRSLASSPSKDGKIWRAKEYPTRAEALGAVGLSE